MAFPEFELALLCDPSDQMKPQVAGLADFFTTPLQPKMLKIAIIKLCTRYGISW